MFNSSLRVVYLKLVNITESLKTVCKIPLPQCTVKYMAATKRAKI